MTKKHFEAIAEDINKRGLVINLKRLKKDA